MSGIRGIAKRNAFIFYSVGCAICYGIHNYMIAFSMQKWRNSVSILFPEFIGFLLVYIIYHLYRAKFEVAKQTGGLWWTKGTSALITSDGKFKLMCLIIILLRGIVADFIPINTSLVTFYSREVGFNPAVIQSFASFSSFTTAVAFYFLYKERLLKQHLLGMLMIISSILIVAITKSIQNKANSNQNDEVNLTKVID